MEIVFTEYVSGGFLVILVTTLHLNGDMNKYPKDVKFGFSEKTTNSGGNR
jgi:hypothetical protein